MEAARTAAMRGHKVTLYSADNFLGGLMPMAAMIKGDYPENIQDIIDWYRLQLKKLGVKVITGKKVTPELVGKLKPDAVVVATGAAVRSSSIPGYDNSKVMGSQSLLEKLRPALKFARPSQLGKITKLWIPIGRSAVIMGGGIKGLQLAAFLVKRGRKVTVVEEMETIGQEGVVTTVWILCNWLRKKGCTLLPGVTYEEINDEGLVITDKHGQRRTIEAESILPLEPLVKDESLAKKLEGIVREIHVCGSCYTPGLIRDATNEGFQAGMAL